MQDAVFDGFGCFAGLALLGRGLNRHFVFNGLLAGLVAVYLDVLHSLGACFEALLLDAFPILDCILYLGPFVVDTGCATNGHGVEFRRLLGVRRSVLHRSACNKVVGILLVVELLDCRLNVSQSRIRTVSSTLEDRPRHTLCTLEAGNLLLTFWPGQVDARLMAAADGVELGRIVLHLALLAGRHLVKEESKYLFYSLGQAVCRGQPAGCYAGESDTSKGRAGCRFDCETKGFVLLGTGSGRCRRDWRCASEVPNEAFQNGDVSHVPGRQRTNLFTMGGQRWRGPAKQVSVGFFFASGTVPWSGGGLCGASSL